jgi:hypothetical protein
MLPIHYHQLYNHFRERERELIARAEREALAKEAHSSARKAEVQRASRPRLAIFGVARSALAHLF